MAQDQSSATLEEVGARAGCSPATVSRVLNNSATVSEAVRVNVLRAVREVGYVPRRRQRPESRETPAGGPRVNNAHDLVQVVLHRCTPMERLSCDAAGVHVEPPAHIDGPTLLSREYSLSVDFYMHIIGAVMDELSGSGRRGLVQATDNLASPELIEGVNRQECAGVLLLGQTSPEVQAFIDACQHPLVLLDILHAEGPDVVTTDNLAGIFLAMDHLLELGHRSIGFVGRPIDPKHDERWGAFVMRLAAAGLPYRPEWVYRGSEHINDTTQGVLEILKQPDLPTAFVCNNDWNAVGVLRAAELAGLRVPEDLSVVGFDDVSAAAMVTPALTTLRVPLRDMGVQALRQLQVARTYPQPSRTRGCVIRLTPELVVRHSTGPAPR